MNIEQMKTEIIEDLKYQIFRKHQRHNWTSEHWYYGSQYDTPREVVHQASKN